MTASRTVLDSGEEVTRFDMRVGNETWPCSINHTHGAVKVQDVVYNREQWASLAQMPLAARLATQRTAQALDGRLLLEPEDGAYVRAEDVVRQ